MRKRSLIAVGITVVLAIGTTACGGDGDDTPNRDDPTTTQPMSEPETDDTTSESPSEPATTSPSASPSPSPTLGDEDPDSNDRRRDEDDGPVEDEEPSTETTTDEDDDGAAYYPNCTAARAAGAAPLFAGEPGYRAELDRDKDGVACE